MARLQETSFCVIGIALLCMNLAKRLRALLHFFSNLVSFRSQLRFHILEACRVDSNVIAFMENESASRQTCPNSVPVLPYSHGWGTAPSGQRPILTRIWTRIPRSILPMQSLVFSSKKAASKAIDLGCPKKMVPLTGLEPVLNHFRWILSPLCLPFHHSGVFNPSNGGM